jgi:hypothetical protein
LQAQDPQTFAKPPYNPANRRLDRETTITHRYYVPASSTNLR